MRKVDLLKFVIEGLKQGKCENNYGAFKESYLLTIDPSTGSHHPKESFVRFAEAVMLTHISSSPSNEAIKALEVSIRFNPNFAFSYFLRGCLTYKANLYVYKNEPEIYNKIVNDYNKAIEIDPNLAVFYLYRGDLNYDFEKYDQAIIDYTKAIELNPTDAEAYYSRGLAYEKTGQQKQAITDFSKAGSFIFMY